jgi:hypothetical protein
MKRLQVLGLALFLGAFLAGVLLEAGGLLSTPIGSWSASFGPLHVTETDVQPNWPLAAPVVAVALAGLACLVLAALRRP